MRERAGASEVSCPWEMMGRRGKMRQRARVRPEAWWWRRFMESDELKIVVRRE